MTYKIRASSTSRSFPTWLVKTDVLRLAAKCGAVPWFLTAISASPLRTARQRTSGQRRERWKRSRRFHVLPENLINKPFEAIGVELKA